LYTEGNYITTNAQNAVFSFTNSALTALGLAQLRVGDFNICNFWNYGRYFIDLNDTRISKLFRPFLTQLQGNTMVYLTSKMLPNSVVLANYSWLELVLEDTSTFKSELYYSLGSTVC
jgi:hypothetical protein